MSFMSIKLWDERACARIKKGWECWDIKLMCTVRNEADVVGRL
jgi:hypothetical protein